MCDFSVADRIATIKLLLRRTLVRSVILLSLFEPWRRNEYGVARKLFVILCGSKAQ